MPRVMLTDLFLRGGQELMGFEYNDRSQENNLRWYLSNRDDLLPFEVEDQRVIKRVEPVKKEESIEHARKTSWWGWKTK